MKRVTLLKLCVVAVVGQGCDGAQSFDAGRDLAADSIVADIAQDVAPDAAADLFAEMGADLERDLGSDLSPDIATCLPLACSALNYIGSPGALADPALGEVSGLTVSQSQADLIWVHNDSGGSAKLYGIDMQGALRAELDLFGAIAIDWEDIASHMTPSGADLYIGEIGDNLTLRPEITVLRLKEPAFTPAANPVSLVVTLLDIDILRLAYPHGAQDAETLMIDPISETMVVVTKDKNQVASRVYRASLHGLSSQSVTMMDHIADLPLATYGFVGDRRITAGDISSDGAVIALRTLDHVLIWQRSGGCDLAQLFLQPPCIYALQPEPQGEALGFVPQQREFVTLSEKKWQPLHHYDF